MHRCAACWLPMHHRRNRPTCRPPTAVRNAVLSAAALTLPICLTAHAYAHASLEESEAAPGTYNAVLRIPHGCDGKPTDTVRIEIPEGFIDAKPMPKPGWTLK